MVAWNPVTISMGIEIPTHGIVSQTPQGDTNRRDDQIVEKSDRKKRDCDSNGQECIRHADGCSSQNCRTTDRNQQNSGGRRPNQANNNRTHIGADQ
jgi:hypothetical protein